MAVEALPEEIRSRVAALGRADTIVAVTAPALGSDGATGLIGRTAEAIGQLSAGGTTVLVHGGGGDAAGGSAAEPVQVLPFPAGVADQVPATVAGSEVQRRPACRRHAKGAQPCQSRSCSCPILGAPPES